MNNNRSYEETSHNEVQRTIAENPIDAGGITEKPGLPETDVEKAYKTIEEGVVGTYKKIEDGVVGGYRKIENGAVSGFRKVSDFFIKKFFSRKGETVEETRKRLRRK